MDCGVRIEVVGPELASVRAAVQRAAFEGSTFSEERWISMAEGTSYADAQCRIAYDDDTAVAAEPMGVHLEHRGRGYGTAITVAAAAALQRLGSSCATVCTQSSNVGAVATYASAGLGQLPEVLDLRRRLGATSVPTIS